MSKEVKKNSKGQFSKVLIALIFTELTVFTIACLIIFYKTGAIPDTLVTCVFAFMSAEGGALAFIKTSKVKHTVQEIIEEVSESGDYESEIVSYDDPEVMEAALEDLSEEDTYGN